MEQTLNQRSLDTLCAALAYAMGVDAPAFSAAANQVLTSYVDKAFEGKKADRIFMYNPDAIGQWIFEKYSSYLTEVTDRSELRLPMRTVMPSVTPVCYGTMYTGAQPEVHGIQAYERPVITIDTLFDALIRVGKKPALVAGAKSSLAHIYLGREMDYFFYPTAAEVNAKAAQLILEDAHDFIVVYNGNYDGAMHRNGPEAPLALAELRVNAHMYAVFDAMINQHWKNHRTLIGFAMDHGAHEIDGNLGSHGLDMPEDLNIIHCYQAKRGVDVT